MRGRAASQSSIPPPITRPSSIVCSKRSCNSPMDRLIRRSIRCGIASVTRYRVQRVIPGCDVARWCGPGFRTRRSTAARRRATDSQSTCPAHRIAANGEPHRAVYFEQRIDDPATIPIFEVEFEYIFSAYCPRSMREDVQPYDRDSPFYREYTAERHPHIRLTPVVRESGERNRGRRDESTRQSSSRL